MGNPGSELISDKGLLMNHSSAKALCQRYCELFSQLTPQTLDQFATCISDDIHFKDPFNDVVGFDQMRKILSDMFEHTEGPAFNVYEQSVFEDHAWIRWQFNATLPVVGKLSVDGASRIQMDTYQGVVTEHLDFWDSAPIYMQLPMLGRILRAIRQRMSIE